MNCVQCSPKYCRHGSSCHNEQFTQDELRSQYGDTDNQTVVQSAADLVDNGKAGTLSRLQEIIEFIKSMKYQKVGLAYCYGMEKDAMKVKEIFQKEGLRLSSVSCTVGGMEESSINNTSGNHGVSCNPLGQAAQLNSEKVDFVLLMGICLGHDILLQKNLKADFTTFVVKDRLFQHQPLRALQS
jgi:uncharacterized metal-binding protein